MAERYERYRRSERESKLRLPAPAADAAKTTTYDPAKQAEGMKTRLEASGVDVEKALDKRSGIEKALNLTEDQNFVFDVFELLGRPQQALFNGIKALQEGGSFGEGFKSGLTGDNYATFASILNNAGLGEEDKFGVDDVIGFIGDVLLDPVDLGILAAGAIAAPVTGGTSLGAAGTTVTALNATAEAGKIGSRIARTAAKAAKASADELVQVAKRVGTRVKATAKTTARFYGDLGTNIIKGQGKEVAKKLFTKSNIVLSDGSVIRKIGISDMTMQAFGGLLKKGGKAVNWTVRTGVIETFATKNAATYIDTWDNWLTSMKGHFNAAARMGEKVFIEAQIAGNKASFGLLWGDAWVRKVNRKIDDIVEDTFKKRMASGQFNSQVPMTAEAIKKEIREGILKDLTQFAEWKYDPKTTRLEVLNHPDRYALPIDEKVKDSIIDAINNPAYIGLKQDLVKSNTLPKLYEKQSRTLTAGLANSQQKFIDSLKSELSGLEQQAAQATPPINPTQTQGAGKAALDFVEGATKKRNPKKLAETLQGAAPQTAGQAALGFVEGATKKEAPEKLAQKLGVPATPTAPAVPPEVTARMNDLRLQIRKAEQRLEYIKKISFDEDGYKSVINEIQAEIAAGRFNQNDLDFLNTLVQKSNKIIDDDAFNLFDEIFVESEAEGVPVWVMRKDKSVEKLIDRINERVEKLTSLLNEDTIELLTTGAKRFAVGSVAENNLRALIKESKFGKQFEDIFEEASGVWVVKDEEALQQLLSFGVLDLGMGSIIDGARFLSEEEFAAIDAKFAAGFEYEAQYQDVIDNMEQGMRWYDQRYGTKFVQDKPGYLRHTLTQEAKDFQQLDRVYKKAFGAQFTEDGTGVLIGNTRTFKTRKYDMTVAEANRIARFNTQRILEDNKIKNFLDPEDVVKLEDKATINMFSEYFTDSLADTFIKMNSYGSAINVMNTALVHASLDGKDVLRFTSDIKKTPAGFVPIEKYKLRDKLERMSKVFGDNASMQKLIKDTIDKADGAYALIDENVFKMIGRLGEPEQVKLLAKLFDITNKGFKKLKVFSAGFHFKNLMGNASNLYLAGVSPTKIAPMLYDGIKSRKRAIGLVDTFAEILQDPSKLDVLLPDPKDKKLFQAYQIFMDGGFDDAGKYLYDLDELIKQQGDRHFTGWQKTKQAAANLKAGKPGALAEAGDALLQFNVDLNSTVDGGYRMGYIMQLMDEGLPPEEIVRRVKLALFDPNTLTAAEETYKKYIPFYTFAKKNLAFQMKNVFENPVQYSRFIKGIKSTWSAFGVDWNTELQGYQKDNLWLPIPFTMKDGKYYQLKTSFPLSDLGEYIENPARKIFASMSPVLRAPVEATLNSQFFTGQPIERFEGQQGKNFPWMSARQEYFLSQTGADRLFAGPQNIYNALAKPQEGGAGGAVAGLLPTVAGQGNIEQARTSQAYDELNQLRDLFKFYKQEQVPILTLAQIENMNKPRETLAQRLAAIQRARGR